MTDEQGPANAKAARRQAKGDVAAAKARAKAERPFWRKKRFIIPAGFVLLIIVVVATTGNGPDEPQVVTDDPEAQEEAEDAAEAAEAAEDAQDEEIEEVAEGFGIGDTVAMGDLEHTFHSARFYDGDEFMEPEDGTRWLLVDVEVTNTADESEPLSSMIMWRLVDVENRSKSQTITGDEQGSVDGELGAGRSMRGEIAYEVEADEAQWELVFEPNLFGFGQAVHEFTAEEME